MIDAEQLTSWGSFLTGLGTVILALLGAGLLAYDLQLRRRQLQEVLSRSYSALTIDLVVKVHRRPSLAGPKPEWIVESRLTAKNGSSEIWAIPAAYLYARAVPGLEDAGSLCVFSERDFEQLTELPQMSEPLNAAAFSGGIWHVAPGETDSVVRWDLVAGEVAERFPTIIVRAQVYSVPSTLLGANYAAESSARELRAEWMSYMEEHGGARRRALVFAQTERNVEEFKVGSWVLLDLTGSRVDLGASRRFQSVLANLCQTGRQVLVSLRPVDAADEPASVELLQRAAGSASPFARAPQ